MFYNDNGNKYQWKGRANTVVYECINRDIAANVEAMLKNDTITSKQVLDKINAKSELNLRVRNNKFEISETPYLKDRELKKGLNKAFEFEGKFYVLKIEELIPAGNKSFDEAKGAITADYQNYLEKIWLDELSKKHPITVNEAVLYSLGQK
jgi:peptidyl-prolyl cis-trans isomerase SurA